MDVTYRKLLPADAKRYRAIRLESLQHHPESFCANVEEQRALPELRFETFIKQRDPSHFVVGAFAQEDLIGICGFAEDAAAPKGTGTLIQMYVRGAFSGQKVGLGLVRATLGEAFTLPEIKRVMLEVKKHNRQAIHVYEQTGFSTVDGEENEPTRDDTQLMVIHAQR